MAETIITRISQAIMKPFRKRVGADELLTEEDMDGTEIVLTEEGDDIECEDR